MTERFTEQVQQIQTGLDTAGASASRSLAQVLDNFSQRAGKERREIVVDRALKEGAKAGQEKADPIENAFTLADQAFNKGLMTSYLSTVDNEGRVKVSEFADTYFKDPESYMMHSQKYKDAILADTPESLKVEVAANLDNQIGRGMIQVQGNAIQEQRNEVQATLENNASDTADEAGRQARLGDDVAAAQEFKKYTNIIDAMDINEGDKEKKIRAEGVRITQQKYLGLGDRLYEEGGINAVNGWLTKNEGKPQDGASSPEWDSITDAMQADANRKESRRRAAGEVSKADIKNRLKDYETAKSLGMDVDKQDEINLTAEIAPFPELVKQKSVIDKTASFSLKPVSERSEILGELSSGNVKLENVDFFVSFSKAQNDLQKLAEKDVVTLGVRQGFTTNFTPLDFSDPLTLELRVKQSDMLEKQYGVSGVLTEQEAEGVAQNLKTMTPQEKTDMALFFQGADAVWGDLDKKNAGLFTIAGASGDVDVMNSIFAGQEAIALKTVKVPTQTDYLADFSDLVGDIYKGADRKQVQDAALAYYAANSDGAKDGNYITDDFEAAVIAVTGGIGKVNGSKVQLPRGVSEDTFDDYIDEFQAESVSDFGDVARYSDEETAEAIRNGTIISIGNNEYVVQPPNAERVGDILFNNDGTPFILKYNVEVEGVNKGVLSSKSRSRRRTSQ